MQRMRGKGEVGKKVVMILVQSMHCQNAFVNERACPIPKNLGRDFDRGRRKGKKEREGRVEPSPAPDADDEGDLTLLSDSHAAV